MKWIKIIRLQYARSENDNKDLIFMKWLFFLNSDAWKNIGFISEMSIIKIHYIPLEIQILRYLL